VLSNFDPIVIDLWTSGMDGFETLETLRMSGVDTPVIITAGYITKEMVSELLPHRIRKIVLKPASRDVFIESIQETVTVQRFSCRPINRESRPCPGESCKIGFSFARTRRSCNLSPAS
jgi:DNA-binding NarL/FixJ family response regulator